MTSKYYLLALANEIEGTPLRLYADAFRNSGAKIETQSARIAELEAALRDVLPYVDTCNSSHREAQAKGYAALEGKNDER